MLYHVILCSRKSHPYQCKKFLALNMCHCNTIITVFTFCTEKYCPRSKYRTSVRGQCNDWWQFSPYRTEFNSLLLLDTALQCSPFSERNPLPLPGAFYTILYKGGSRHKADHYNERVIFFIRHFSNYPIIHHNALAK